jgi:hypothetical protein
VTVTRTTTEDGLTFTATLTRRFITVRGPLEHKRPQRAMYDIADLAIVRWPENRNERRRLRFNNAAWRLIHEILDETA